MAFFLGLICRSAQVCAQTGLPAPAAVLRTVAAGESMVPYTSFLADPLTGIYNRGGLAVRAQELLILQRQRTVILIDLDKFKPINDLHGHAAGDAMLVEVARRLTAQMRTSDIVARVGGDGFVVPIVEPHDRVELEAICRRLLAANCEPLMFQGTPLRVGASMGLARYPTHGTALTDLLHAADVAMYHIKKNGRAGFLSSKT